MFNYYDVIIFNLVVCNVRFTLSLLLLIGLALEKAVFMIYCISVLIIERWSLFFFAVCLFVGHSSFVAVLKGKKEEH